MLFYYRNNLDVETGRGGAHRAETSREEKRSGATKTTRETDSKGQEGKKGQHQLTDVIRNEGNMAHTTSLFPPLFLSHTNTRVTLKVTHIAPSSTRTFPPPVGQCAGA